ncbi:MAG: dTDP-4-dehydrorhamnose reductase [Lachnospirales bacterium]
MIKVWLSGANSQVGKAINEIFCPTDLKLLNTDKDEIDVTKLEEVLNFSQLNRPDIIINCSAITDISLCEKDPKLAYAVNAIGARNLSIAARNCGAKIVQISTDDVFDGLKNKPYNEFDIPNPQTVYGKSKCAGEGYVKEFTQRHFIIRSSWVYGKGNNFINKFIEDTKNNKEISAAYDQFGSPTSALELAKFILFIMKTSEFGTYHATNKGLCSRFELAEKIAYYLDKHINIKPIASKDNPYSAVRPNYGVLDNFIMSIVSVYEFPHWEKSLAEYLEGVKENG